MDPFHIMSHEDDLFANKINSVYIRPRALMLRKGFIVPADIIQFLITYRSYVVQLITYSYSLRKNNKGKRNIYPIVQLEYNFSTMTVKQEKHILLIASSLR